MRYAATEERPAARPGPEGLILPSVLKIISPETNALKPIYWYINR